MMVYIDDDEPMFVEQLGLDDARAVLSRTRASLPWAFNSAHAVALRDEIADRKSTRLNSSHRCSSYAVCCLKKKRKQTSNGQRREKVSRICAAVRVRSREKKQSSRRRPLGSCTTTMRRSCWPGLGYHKASMVWYQSLTCFP